MKRGRISYSELQISMHGAQLPSHQCQKRRELPPPVTTTMAELSDRILINILSWLPTKAILICRSVCKRWRMIILANTEFAKLHWERSSVGGTTGMEVMLRQDGHGSLSRTLFLLDLDKLRPYAKFLLPLNDELACSGIDVVNSCNGLMCLCKFLDKTPVLVCNPVTGEYINIPEADRGNVVDGSEETLVASGFGFSPTTVEYKVLRIFSQKSLGFGGHDYSHRRFGEIISLGKGSWRRTELAPQIPHCFLFGTYLKDTIYWLCAMDDKVEFIISFNFDNEHFKILRIPPYFNADKKEVGQIRMQELEGSLCVCDFSPVESFDIWLMKEFNGRNYWNKGYVVYLYHDKYYQPITLVNKTEILMMEGGGALVSYSNSDMVLTYLKVKGIQSHFGASVFRPSFVPLKEILKGGNLQVLVSNQRRSKKPKIEWPWRCVIPPLGLNSLSK